VRALALEKGAGDTGASLRPSGSGQNVGVAFGRGFFDLICLRFWVREGLHRGEGKGRAGAHPFGVEDDHGGGAKGSRATTREEECGDGALPHFKKKGEKRPRAVV